MYHHTGPAPGIMVWGGIGFHCRTPLVRTVGTLNNQHYISEVLEPVDLPYIQRLPSAIFQQDNARPHVARNFQVLVYASELYALLACSRSISNRKSVVHAFTTTGPRYTTR
ncbi:transposable element Tcb1 transposase [Trichonephila clavipes]|nr:transposable element Tcb1 transposase [Trichonephila clavipes]